MKTDLFLRLEVIVYLSEFDSVNIRKSMTAFDTAAQFDGYSKVVLIVSDEIQYSAGTDTGRTLTITCPWGNQTIADNILKSISGFQYQPLTAEGALIDPAAEIGDGITANGVYSGIYSMDLQFDSLLPAKVSAPADEELYEEHTYIPKTDRVILRKFLSVDTQFRIQDGKITAEVEERKSDIKSVKATLEVHSDRITAKINKNDGNSQTFGWSLQTDSWRIFSGSNTVIKADRNGLEVKGIIRATGGEIGGFSIQKDYLCYNNQTWGGTNTRGIYIGTSGIQCGSAKNGVQITPNGQLYAENGYFRGRVDAGSINYGGDAGHLWGEAISEGSVSGGWGGQIAGGSIGTFNTSGGINTSLGYADYANGVFSGWNVPSRLIVSSLTAQDYFYFGNVQVTRQSVRVMTGPNAYRNITFLAC